jgi:hypothetical protein
MLIQHTTYGVSSALEMQAKRAFPYLAANKALITPSKEEYLTLSGMRSFIKSTVVDLFKRIVDDGILPQFSIMNATLANADIPDILTMDELTIDGKYIEGAPNGFNQPWINITPLLARRRTKSDPLVVADIPRACGYFVRANLCAGYHDKAESTTESWLSPSLEVFVIESYSMTVTLLLQRVYNLDPNEARLVQTMFAYHYAKLLSTRVIEGNVPAILSRCSFLGSLNDIHTILDMANEKLDGKLANANLITICNVLPLLGPGRMAKFDPSILFRMFSASAVDSQSMAIALDYPPYWVFQILKYMAGAKNYVIGQTMQMPIMKRESIKFEQSIMTQRGLIHKR